MGKSKQQKNNQRRLDDRYNIQSEREKGLWQAGQERFTGAAQRADQQRDYLWNNWAGFADGSRSEALPYYREFAQTGGYDPSELADIRGRLTLSDSLRNNIYGNGVFKEFSETGGWNDADKANYRARVASQTPAFFESLRNRLENAGRASGGATFNPGYTSQMRNTARDQARGSMEATREGELKLQGEINEGRRYGGDALSRAGLGEAGFNLNAANQLAQLAQMVNSGRQYGISGLDEQGRLEMGALGQMQNLYGMEDPSLSWYRTLLGMANPDQALGMNMQYNPNQSWLDRLMPLFQAAPGMLSAFGGFGGGGGGSTGQFIPGTMGQTKGWTPPQDPQVGT